MESGKKLVGGLYGGEADFGLAIFWVMWEGAPPIPYPP